MYLNVVLRLPREAMARKYSIGRRVLAPDGKRAATLSPRGTGDETGTRGTGKGGIKGQEINASISSNTVEHSSALWRRVCTPHTFFLLFEKLLRVEPFIQLNRWDRESAGRPRVRVPRLGRIFPTCHFAAPATCRRWRTRPPTRKSRLF